MIYLNKETKEKSNMALINEHEDLFNSRSYYAKESVEYYIKELDKHRDDKDYVIDLDDLDDLEFLLNEYGLIDKKIEAYEIIGDIYFNARDYEKEYEYMSRAWELGTICPDKKSYYRIMIKLANNYIERGKCQDAIRLYQKALLNIDEIPENYLGYLYYNYALANYRLDMFTIALGIISDLLRFTERKDYDLWAKAYALEGVCYFRMGDYELALSSYNKALQVMTFTGCSEAKYLIYGNMAEVYTKFKDNNRAYKYLDGIIKDIDEIDKSSYEYPRICNQLAVSYENLGDLEKAEKHYKESLEYSKKNVQKDYVLKNLISLIDLNTKIKVKDIGVIMEKYSDHIIQDIKINDSLLVFLKCLKTYINNKEYDGFAKLIDNIIE